MLAPLIGLLLFAGPAKAASCSSYAAKAKAARGSKIGQAFSQLAKCDTHEAQATFEEVLDNAKDLPSVLGLFQGAIQNKVWVPVWGALEHWKDYDTRDHVAKGIGQACTGQPQIVNFLKGAYYNPEVRDQEFQQWDDAFIACKDPELAAWVSKQAENPPKKMFDDKYSALLGVLVSQKGPLALPHLTQGAIKAADGGPFDTMLTQMDAAIRPDLGMDPEPEDKAALERALVTVAKGIPADKAHLVADRLANAGAESEAAKLLPVVYPGLADQGWYTYGAAAIERADCDGKKKAVIHLATVREAGKRWFVLSDIRVPLQAVKPKLGKCTSEGSWGVSTTPNPVGSSKEIAAWADKLISQWEEKGYEVSKKTEKQIQLD
jgi:hypothetical protein